MDKRRSHCLLKTHKLVNLRRNRGSAGIERQWECSLTWIGAGNHGRSSKIAACRGRILLKIAIERKRSVVLKCIWVVTASTLLDLGTVSSSSATGVVQRRLKSRLRCAGPGHAPALSWNRRRVRRCRRGYRHWICDGCYHRNAAWRSWISGHRVRYGLCSGYCNWRRNRIGER